MVPGLCGLNIITSDPRPQFRLPTAVRTVAHAVGARVDVDWCRGLDVQPRWLTGSIGIGSDPENTTLRLADPDVVRGYGGKHDAGIVVAEGKLVTFPICLHFGNVGWLGTRRSPQTPSGS